MMGDLGGYHEDYPPASASFSPKMGSKSESSPFSHRVLLSVEFFKEFFFTQPSDSHSKKSKDVLGGFFA